MSSPSILCGIPMSFGTRTSETHTCPITGIEGFTAPIIEAGTSHYKWIDSKPNRLVNGKVGSTCYSLVQWARRAVDAMTTESKITAFVSPAIQDRQRQESQESGDYPHFTFRTQFSHDGKVQSHSSLQGTDGIPAEQVVAIVNDHQRQREIAGRCRSTKTVPLESSAERQRG